MTKSLKKKNAALAFGQLITSLTSRKRRWTPAERLCFNRVAAFLGL